MDKRSIDSLAGRPPPFGDELAKVSKTLKRVRSRLYNYGDATADSAVRELDWAIGELDYILDQMVSMYK